MIKKYEQAQKILDKGNYPYILFSTDEDTVVGKVKGKGSDVELMLLSLFDSILGNTVDNKARLEAMVMLINCVNSLLNHFDKHEIDAIKKEVEFLDNQKSN